MIVGRNPNDIHKNQQRKLSPKSCSFWPKAREKGNLLSELKVESVNLGSHPIHQQSYHKEDAEGTESIPENPLRIRRTIAPPGDDHLSETRLQEPPTAFAPVAPRDSIRAYHTLADWFLRTALVEVSLDHAAQQLAPFCLHRDYPWTIVHAHLSGTSDGVVLVKPLLARVGDWKRFISGTNESNDDVFLRHEDPVRRSVDVGPGEVLGHYAFFTGGRHTVTAVAAQDCDFLVLVSNFPETLSSAAGLRVGGEIGLDAHVVCARATQVEAQHIEVLLERFGKT
jgi:hypothetical protein